MNNKNILLINENYNNVLDTFNNKNIDLVISDLPYNSKLTDNDLQLELKRLWHLLKKVIKPNANILFFCNTRFGHELIKSNPNWFRYELVWNKNLNIKYNKLKVPIRQHEMIYLFSNPNKSNKTYNYNKYKITSEFYNKKTKKKVQKYYYKHPSSILNFTTNTNNHPHEKPLDLLDWLIKTYSNESEIVLDFHMNSGSVGLSALNNNRKFIGIEENKQYYNLALQRLNYDT